MNGIVNQRTVVKEYEFSNPDIDKVDHLLAKVNKTVEKNYFHLFEFRCVYDIKFTNLTNNEEVFYHLVMDLWNLFLNTNC